MSPRPARIVLGLLAWAVVAVLAGGWVFLHDSRRVVLATHDAVLRPTLDGYVVVRTGPVLPDLRRPTGSPVGVDIVLGKTTAGSPGELVRRYGVLGANPDAPVAKARGAVTDMLLDASLVGAVAGLVPVGVWLLVGRRRRTDLAAAARARLRGLGVPGRAALGGGVVLVLVAGGLAWWRPWVPAEEPVVESRPWQSIAEFTGLQPPEGLEGIELRGDVLSSNTRRLVESALRTYEKSRVFYDRAVESAAELELRAAGEEETVVVLVSDRHDNVGMDRVARAIGEAAGATGVMNAGDDTSTGESWELFSVESVSDTFADWDRWAVTGNHDHGDVIGTYLADRGWTRLDGEVVDGPGGSTILGADDPRSSGLGSWRDETGLTFAEVTELIGETACAEEEPVGTILVHDTDLARTALDGGCVDLVVGGHNHEVSGPTAVPGENGHVGHEYVTGTTGGAAYAIAMGSKPRRPAVVSLVTYADGRPVGVQTVTLQTNGSWLVGGYQELAALTPVTAPRP